MNPSGPSAFCFRRLLIIDSIFKIGTGPFRYLFLSCVSFDRLYLSRKWSVSSRVSDLWAYSSSYYSGLLWFPLSFLILVICVLSFFFHSYLEAYLFDLSFQSVSFAFVSFAIGFLFSILLISPLIFVLSFHLLTWIQFVLLFLVS
jgi:hypothetical protein